MPKSRIENYADNGENVRKIDSHVVVAIFAGAILLLVCSCKPSGGNSSDVAGVLNGDVDKNEGSSLPTAVVVKTPSDEASLLRVRLAEYKTLGYVLESFESASVAELKVIAARFDLYQSRRRELYDEVAKCLASTDIRQCMGNEFGMFSESVEEIPNMHSPGQIDQVLTFKFDFGEFQVYQVNAEEVRSMLKRVVILGETGNSAIDMVLKMNRSALDEYFGVSKYETGNSKSLLQLQEDMFGLFDVFIKEKTVERLEYRGYLD